MRLIQKIFFLPVIFFISLSFVHAQDKDVGLVGLRGDNFISSSRSFAVGGLAFEYRFNKHFGIGYSFLAGYSNPNTLYLHTGIGQYAFGYMVSHFRPDNLTIYLMIFAIILPENFNFRVPINEKSAVSFFISPYGFEYFKDSFDDKGYVSCEFGIKYHYKLSPSIEVAPHLGIKKFYSQKIEGFSVGASLLFGKGKEAKDINQE